MNNYFTPLDQIRKICIDLTDLVRGSFGYSPSLEQKFPLLELMCYLLNIEKRHPNEIHDPIEDLDFQLNHNLELFIEDMYNEENQINQWLYDDEMLTFMNSLFKNLIILFLNNPCFQTVRNGFAVEILAPSTVNIPLRYEFILETF